MWLARASGAPAPIFCAILLFLCVNWRVPALVSASPGTHTSNRTKSLRSQPQANSKPTDSQWSLHYQRFASTVHFATTHTSLALYSAFVFKVFLSTLELVVFWAAYYPLCTVLRSRIGDHLELTSQTLHKKPHHYQYSLVLGGIGCWSHDKRRFHAMGRYKDQTKCSRHTT